MIKCNQTWHMNWIVSLQKSNQTYVRIIETILRMKINYRNAKVKYSFTFLTTVYGTFFSTVAERKNTIKNMEKWNRAVKRKDLYEP